MRMLPIVVGAAIIFLVSCKNEVREQRSVGLAQKIQEVQATCPIRFDQETIDVGCLRKDDEPVEAVYRFTNLGETVVVIHDIKTDCGCTEAFWDKEPVSSGKSGTIRIRYDGRGKPEGTFLKTVGIYTNINPSPMRVYLKGEMKG